MKPAAFAFFLLSALSPLAPGDEKPVHTFDRSHGVGKLVFGSAPHHLRAAGLEIKNMEVSEDRRMAVYELEDLSEMALGPQYRATLYFLDGMLYRIHVHPAGDAEAAMLERLAARLNSEADMQKSRLFHFHYSPGPRHAPGRGWVSTPRGLAVVSVPLAYHARARTHFLEGNFENTERTRTSAW